MLGDGYEHRYSKVSDNPYFARFKTALLFLRPGCSVRVRVLRMRSNTENCKLEMVHINEKLISVELLRNGTVLFSTSLQSQALRQLWQVFSM